MSRRCEVKPGDRFGRYTVLAEAGKLGNLRAVLCRCDCGTEKVVRLGDLVAGRTLSCGCYHQEIASDIHATHRCTNERLYKVWKDMKKRCNNSNATNYKYYGGKGVEVCEEWNNDYLEFKQWAVQNGGIA